ncbi:Ig-like domain-containing protein [Pyxidicoccus parkwayensis]|uniref:Ig-like domain-containing protein n=1 Tax=Pyxidicoccus parkwayensis TaxID=2813578 RepID=A0ABX7P418_9BACT|nr:Ig-like domain-containing protein [Pyxidicoccus parkwaysis]QSQ25214.1 Ig-like domain-containing protein [Pyxidicoccus parkwaysis]
MLTLLGCGDLSNGDPPPVDLPPADALILDINGARDTDYVRGTLLIDVQATGATPDKVELLRDGTAFVTLVPPFEYTWDTVDLPESSYRITARAVWKGRTFESPVHTVVVDRTAPKVVQTSPSGTNVSIKEGSELKVRFSEPMLASSVPDDTFIGEDISFRGALSQDGQELTASQSAHAPSTPKMSLNLEGLTDLAGNPVDSPGGKPTLDWIWTLPAFLTYQVDGALDDYRTVKEGVALAVGADGALLAAYSADDGSSGSEALIVRRWTGSGWEMVGTPVPTSVPSEVKVTVRNPLLVVGADGNPVVAFIRGYKEASLDSLAVVRWDGAQWRPVWDLYLSPDRPRIYGAALVVDRKGRLVTAWAGLDGVQVLRLEVYGPNQLGHFQRATYEGQGRISEQSPTLVVDADNRPIVAWAESEQSAAADLYVRRWNGSDWEALGGKLAGPTTPGMSVRSPSLIVSKDNQPQLVWSVQPDASVQTEARAYVATWSGTSWSTAPLNPSNSGDVERRGAVAALTPEGDSLFAWSGGGQSSDIYVAWNRSGTSGAVDTVGNHSTGPLSLVSDARGRPALAWQSGSDVYVTWPNQ